MKGKDLRMYHDCDIVLEWGIDLYKSIHLPLRVARFSEEGGVVEIDWDKVTQDKVDELFNSLKGVRK